jgi:dihydroorotate dehydrogenase (fumarate)
LRRVPDATLVGFRGALRPAAGLTTIRRALNRWDALTRPARAAVLVSALLRNWPGHLRRSALRSESWMDEHEWDSLGDMRGNMSLQRIPDPAAYERANFRMALR